MLLRIIRYTKNAKKVKKILPHFPAYKAVFEFTKIWFLNRFIYNPLKLKNRDVKFLGYKISAPSRKHLILLLREVFMEISYLTHNTKSNPVIYDFGGNIGISVLFFKQAYPNSKIDVFEPNTNSLSFLEKNIKQNNLSNVTIHNIAAGDFDGEIEFFIHDEKSCAGSASIYPSERLSYKISVPCKCASNFINEQVDIMKMDVEGAEHAIIKDLYESGKLKMVDSIIAEYHHNIPNQNGSFGEMLSQLENSGFTSQILAPIDLPLVENTVQIMVLYSKNKNIKAS